MAQAPLVNFVNMLVIITCKQQISAGKLTCSFLIIIHHLKHDLDSSYSLCVHTRYNAAYIYTAESFYNRHHWGPTFCPLYIARCP